VAFHKEQVLRWYDAYVSQEGDAQLLIPWSLFGRGNIIPWRKGEGPSKCKTHDDNDAL
jgi:hypothetical protein